jgi:hypothetical protein
VQRSNLFCGTPHQRHPTADTHVFSVWDVVVYISLLQLSYTLYIIFLVDSKVDRIFFIPSRDVFGSREADVGFIMDNAVLWQFLSQSMWLLSTSDPVSCLILLMRYALDRVTQAEPSAVGFHSLSGRVKMLVEPLNTWVIQG